MKTQNAFGILAILLMLSVFTACEDDSADIDQPTDGTLTLDIRGLEDLGSDFAYEGWLIVNGSPVSAGIFNVDGSGNLSSTSFTIDQAMLDQATAYVLTIEPSPDTDPAPSDVHILAGDFSGNTAAVVVEHPAAINASFDAATGNYILATPTDGNMDMNENSGVWWLDNSSGSPVAGLSLPTLPSGWAYEGWVVVNGSPLSTGTFTDPSGSDNSAPFSGSAGGPPFPGEDLLLNAPAGFTFPTDLSGATVVISVEPQPDNSPAPFLLKPLVAQVPNPAMDHSVYSMDNNAEASNPTGTVSR